MIELKRDMVRQMALRNATRDVQENGLEDLPGPSILEQRDAMRLKMQHPKRKRRIPWFTIITIVTTIPFFMGDGTGNMMNALSHGGANHTVQKMKDPAIVNHFAGKDTKVSVTIGGQTFEKEITAQDVRAVQSRL